MLLDAALTESRGVLEASLTEEMSTNDTHAEQHYQNSKTDLNDFELRVENAKAAGVALVVTDNAEDDPPALLYAQAQMPNVPLGLVVSTCPEISTYADQRIRQWHDLVRSAEIVRPMMGISPSAWDEAKSILGPEEASVVLAAMLQRFSEIKSAGGYLRTLVGKAAVGAFSSGPMIMALMRRSAA
ncbi:MAG: plasmid replication protein RepC [Gemmobacter sp.]